MLVVLFCGFVCAVHPTTWRRLPDQAYTAARESGPIIAAELAGVAGAGGAGPGAHNGSKQCQQKEVKLPGEWPCNECH